MELRSQFSNTASRMALYSVVAPFYFRAHRHGGNHLWYRAVAQFFVGGGGGTLVIAKGRSLVGGVGISSPTNMSNLDVLKRYFQHKI